MDKKTKTEKVWICESVFKLKGVGQQAKSKMDELSIHKIADLQLHGHRHGIPKVHIRGFGQIHDISLQDIPGNPPPSFKDHRKSKNPYLSRYGDIWVEKLKSYTSMYNFFCIADLIRFVMNEAEKLMKGSVHEYNFFIFHYDLVLMIAKEKINWMIQNGYLHIWLLPLNGLQCVTPYAGRPIVNSPKFMPLDNSLNREILHSLCMHSVLSCYILDGKETDKEERNICFSYSTPR